MKKARHKSVLVILILLTALVISLVQWPQAQAITPQSQSIGINNTRDDKFITEAGVGIDAWLCHITDPNMDVVSYLVFRGLDINGWEPLTNATLCFRTTVELDFDANSKVTIYGMKVSDLQDEGHLSNAWIMSVPKTSAHVVVDTSDFYGQKWHNYSVTNIVEELKQSIHWDGHGRSADEIGDDIGFVILGAEGYDTRWFIDYHYGTPSLAAHLVIHWNHEFSPPPDMPDYAEFNETRGNYTIWKKSFSARIDVAYWNGTHEQYVEVNTNSSDVEITGVSTQGNKPASYQIVRGLEDDVFYLGRVGTNQTLFHSYDEGETWDNYTLNDQYAELIGNSNKDGSLAFDSLGDLWIVWSSKSDLIDNGEYAIHSTNVNITDHVLGFNDDVEYIPPNKDPWAMALDQDKPSLWIDENDRKHLVHDGYYPGGGYGDQIYYTYKDNEAWTGRVILTSTASSSDYEAGQITTSDNGTFMVAVHNVDHLAVYFHYFKTEWDQIGISVGANDRGGHIAYNDNEDKVLLVYDDNGDLYSQIFNFSDETVSSPLDIGVDGSYPDMTFDIEKNDALMVYDAGDDGLQGIIYDFDTESWGTNFSIRDINPGYIHTVSLATIDIGGTGEPLEEWYVHETDVCTVTGPFDDYNSTIEWIDIEDPDPEDPDPPGWDETGPFTRFRMRLYFLILGFGCLFGPLLFFAWKRPSGYYIMCGAIVMLMGIGMLLSIGQV